MENSGKTEFQGRAVYENVNSEIAALYRQERHVLDIGCGTGALGAWIKGKNPHSIVHGIDISPEACHLARERLDRVWCLDLDRETLPDNIVSYDLIILGDLLEHLKRPDLVLTNLHEHLTSEGKIILSVPNIANYSIRLRLLRGEFRYTETGILDRTHLRFFTLQTITDLIRTCGFTISAQRFISRFPVWLCRQAPGLLAAQFVFRVQRSKSMPTQLKTNTESGS